VAEPDIESQQGPSGDIPGRGRPGRAIVSDQARTPRRRAPGERARALILATAARLSSVEGLDGLSIGRLAEVLNMPKSSVYVLFGSKEELQLATVDAAAVSFQREVIDRAITSTEPGRDRLLALCEGFLSYVERRVFPGGCFFVAASAELGARHGRVHDRVAAYQQYWRDLLRGEATIAHEQRQLTQDTDPAQLAFELGALLAGTDIVAVLHNDDAAVQRARIAVAKMFPPVPSDTQHHARVNGRSRRLSHLDKSEIGADRPIGPQMANLWNAPLGRGGAFRRSRGSSPPDEPLADRLRRRKDFLSRDNVETKTRRAQPAPHRNQVSSDEPPEQPDGHRETFRRSPND
jgi:AcrR family transcriptional regulator